MFAHLPYPNAKHIAIHILPAAERSIRAGHPWLYDQSIRKQSFEGQPGDIAIIFDQKNRFLAAGLYDQTSPIRVKILQFHTPATINDVWFADKLRKADKKREPLHDSDTSGYRLVYGENDGFPGMIIDKYEHVLVMKLYTAAWIPHLHTLLPVLRQVFTYDHLVLRLSRSLHAQPEYLHGLYDGQLLTATPLEMPVCFLENGLKFSADVIRGHKTGFFFDHRENRQRVKTLAKNRHVLDVFAYVGAFSLYAAAGGAKSILSVDVSQPALEAAVENFHLNQHIEAVCAAHHETICDDAFRSMETLKSTKRRFDMVIIDPPAFAKSSREVDKALNAYTHMTRLAVDLVNSGGILVVASCSSRVSRDDFFRTITQAVERPAREIARTGHAIDHPIGFPEGEYLKCWFAHID